MYSTYLAQRREQLGPQDSGEWPPWEQRRCQSITQSRARPTLREIELLDSPSAASRTIRARWIKASLGSTGAAQAHQFGAIGIGKYNGKFKCRTKHVQAPKTDIPMHRQIRSSNCRKRCLTLY
jgi:hypothetical protein